MQRKVLVFIVTIIVLISCNNVQEQTAAVVNNDSLNILHKQDSGNSPLQIIVDTATELFQIAGTYIYKNDVSNCTLKLDILEENGAYTYRLKTPIRNLTGSISLVITEKKDGYYITINNIEWSENLGALDEEGNPVDEDVELPPGLQGSLYENTIVIQNSGNAMNYYVQLADCDAKFIEFEKIK